MATDKPRINMALRQEHYDVVTRLAKLQGRSRSAVVVELLEAAIPVLERVVVVGEAAKRAHVVANEELRSSLEKAEAALMPHVNAALGQLDMLLPAGDAHEARLALLPPARAGSAGPGAKALARAPRAIPKAPRGPRPVTRGSTRRSTSGKKRARKAAKTQ